MLDQGLLQAAPGLGGSGHIAAEADAELVGHTAALQGFAVGRQVGLAVVFAFPAAIGRHGFAHVEQQRLLEIRRSIQHQIDGSSGMGTVGPAPEAERQWREGQGVDGGHRIAAAGPEQVGLICALRRAAKQRGLMVMQPLLPGPQLIGIQRQLRWR